MISRALLPILAMLLAAPAAAGETARIVYLGLADDPYYEPRRSYTGLVLEQPLRPVDGARVALKGARVVGRALGIAFELEEVMLEDGADVVGAVAAAGQAGALAVLLDLPADDMRRVAEADGAGGVLFNIRHTDDRWRGADCAPALLHTMPSRSMLTDAIAQHLRLRGWERILLLRGETPEDEEEARAIRASIGKFGLDLLDERTFAVTNDPRRREASNIALLTGGSGHDVIWIADSEGEFGRFVEYGAYSARPVVGSEGLGAFAWHWTLERYGAPQLNQRFRREADREMASADWAAWAAVRAVVEAVTRLRGADPSAVAAEIASPDLAIDLYKGVRGNFRAWDGQLRQPILLATHNAVISVPPLEGFEHRLDVLDTLGTDEPETTCDR